MHISRIFIERPVMTALVTLAILMFGIVAFRSLPVAALPTVDYPTIQVNAALPGANPETMASSVATPLERQFSTIAGVQSMSSQNSQGTTTISVQFTLARDIDAAAQDIQAAIAKAEGLLPSNMPHPPSYQKTNPADRPVLYLSLTSDTLPLYTVDEYAETLLAQRISMASGVSSVEVYGAQKYAVRVQVNPDELAARGIGFDEVMQAIQRSNVNLPTGRLYGEKQAFTVQSSGELTRAAAYRPFIVSYKNGVPIRLEQLANVIDGVENDKTVAWFNGVRGMILGIQRQPGTNTVEVVDNIKALLPQFRAEIPPSVKLDVAFDASESIRGSIHDVEFTLVLTVCLVVMVIFVFLRNLSATLIPGAAVPLSIIGTFAAMYLLGYSLNNLSLMALTLSVGFVVDDAIVMLENIVRYMEMGKGRMEAALLASKEIGFTIISMTISLAAVFIPVLFMSGIMGRLFHEFAVVIMVAIVISGVVSLSLTPMLCSRFLKPVGARQNAFQRSSEKVFDGMRDFYGWTLRGVIRHRFLTMLTAAGTLAATIYLYGLVPKGFIPNQDTGQLSGSTEAPQDISFEGMVERQKEAATVITAEPDIEAYSSSVGQGGGGVSGGNAGRVFVRLKPRQVRQHTPEQVIERLRPKLNAIPGIRTYLQNPPPVRIGGQVSRSLYQYTLQAPE